MHKSATKNQYLILSEQRVLPETGEDLIQGKGFLKFGDRNSLVSQIQQMLINVGIRKNEPNDYYDNQTYREVIKFQKRYPGQLAVDGKVGKYTYPKLVEAQNETTPKTIDDIIQGGKVLTLGQQGEIVGKVQNMLKQSGFPIESLTPNVFDVNMKNQIYDFQQKHVDPGQEGIVKTLGKIDSQTLEKLIQQSNIGEETAKDMERYKTIFGPEIVTDFDKGGGNLEFNKGDKGEYVKKFQEILK